MKFYQEMLKQIQHDANLTVILNSFQDLLVCIKEVLPGDAETSSA
jgi:hypothetical protein